MNSKALIKAAEKAGLRRIVHISITNPSEDSPYPYFRGKALVEKAVTSSKLSYAILRPALLFGPEDILINNIAWLLRRSPVFTIFGSGSYLVQPAHVDDLAEMAVREAQHSENVVKDAVGPEIYTFEEMVRLIATKIQARTRIVHLHPEIALFLARLAGRLVGDVLMTRDEMEGLMSDLLVSKGPPTTPTRLSEYLDAPS